MADATSRALGINELLCMIIEELPVCEIFFTGQRVSKQWKAVIEESPTIQWKMFLKAKAAPVEPVLIDIEKGLWDYQRELLINFIPCFDAKKRNWEPPPHVSELDYWT